MCPSMVGIMAACECYAQQGDTDSVCIIDDGVQLTKPNLMEARKAYYRENGIGYTSRVPACKTPEKEGSLLPWFRRSDKTARNDDEQDRSQRFPQERSNTIGFKRKGKFETASNMNYGLTFSNLVQGPVSLDSGRMRPALMRRRRFAC